MPLSPPTSLPERIFKRFLLWTLICTVSAVPSFIWAQEDYDRGAMLVGVALFILAYTAFTSTNAFERFKNRPFMRRTLYIGYGVRLFMSVLFPVGMFLDLYPGMLSVSLVERLDLEFRGFERTLLTTIVQGAFLNILLTAFMAVVYSFQRLTMKPPPEAMEHGFAVIMPADPAKRLPSTHFTS